MERRIRAGGLGDAVQVRELFANAVRERVAIRIARGKSDLHRPRVDDGEKRQRFAGGVQRLECKGRIGRNAVGRVDASAPRV